MSAVIKPIGVLKQYTHGMDEVVVDSGISLQETLIALGIPPEIIALVLVNNEPSDKMHILSDGETIQLIAVIGGGSSCTALSQN